MEAVQFYAFRFFNAKGDGRIRRVWNMVVSLCVMIAVLLVMAFYLPKLIGMGVYVVTSGSMEPEYPVGSIIYVQDVEPNQIQVGDPITFYMSGTNIIATHQVYEIDAQNRQFRTQGINNIGLDGEIIQDAEPVSFGSYIGKPIFCIPYLGHVNRFCTTAPGYWIVMAGVVLVIITSFMLDRLPENKVSERENFKDKEKT